MVPLLTVLVLAIAYVSLAAFAWATRRHFVVSGSMPLGMKLVFLLNVLGGVWFTAAIALSGSGPGSPYAAALMSAALMLFCATIMATRASRLPIAFATELPGFIYRTGPYRYVRHPFYVSYMLFWTGTALAVSSLAIWAVPLVMCALYMSIALSEERRLSTSRLAEAYRTYRTTTGMFIPSIFRSPQDIQYSGRQQVHLWTELRHAIIALRLGGVFAYSQEVAAEQA